MEWLVFSWAGEKLEYLNLGRGWFTVAERRSIYHPMIYHGSLGLVRVGTNISK
jgi:hypothetical protein